MRPMPFVALAAAAVLAAATPVLGAPTYDIGRAHKWKAGDTVTTTSREEQYREIRFPSREGVDAPSRPLRLKIAYTQVEKCLEADLDGACLKALVHFPQWHSESGSKKDTSLQGAFLEVAGKGTSRSWRLLHAPGELSKDAGTWAERLFGHGRPDAEALRRTWLPRVPAAVGDAWSADLPSFLQTLSLGDRVDLGRAASNCRMASVDGGFGKVVCEAKLPFRAFPAARGGTPLPWSQGGTQTVKGVVTVAVEGRLVASTGSWSSTLEGEAETDGRSVALLLKLDRTVEVKPGGEMPDPPESRESPGSTAPAK